MKIMEVLRRSAMFSGLPEDELRHLSDMALGKRLKKNELIFSEGEAAEGFYLLGEGQVKIYKLSPDGKEQILRIVKPGGIFGEAPVFSGQSYPAFARAMTDGRAVYFPADRFRKQVKADPELALHMLSTMSQHLHRFASLVEQLTLRDVRARLAEYLLHAPSDSSGRVKLDITKRALALHLGTQPETLSRALSAMQADGILNVRGRTIEIIDAQKLEHAAGGE